MMRFVGQGAETDLTIQSKSFKEFPKEQIRELFDDEYRRLYGRTYPETPVEFVTFKVRASLPERPFNIPRLKTGKNKPENYRKGERPAFSVIKKDFIQFTVYDRSKLYPGIELTGPAIIEERESTIVIGEDARWRVDEYGFIWIELGKE